MLQGQSSRERDEHSDYQVHQPGVSLGGTWKILQGIHASLIQAMQSFARMHVYVTVISILPANKLINRMSLIMNRHISTPANSPGSLVLTRAMDVQS